MALENIENTVSVIIPAFNAEKTIEEAIWSIINQSYSNLEIIVIDDHSTDNTWSVLDKLSKLDHRIKFKRNVRNKGICGALNYALELACGTYIARMDADDIAEIDRIEKQVTFLLKNRQYSLVGVSACLVDEENRNILSNSKFPCTDWLVENTLRLASPISHNWLCYKYIYDELSGYRELKPVEDYDFLLRMHSKGHKFINLPYVGMRIRTSATGVTATSGIKQKLAFNYVLKLYKERQKTGLDSYDAEDFLKAITPSNISMKLFNGAQKVLSSAIQFKSLRIILIPAFCILSLLSPLQLQYFIRRLSLRIIFLAEKLK